MRVFVLISAAAGLLLTGCSQNSSSTSQPTSTQSNPASQTIATPNLGGVLGQAQKYSVGQIDLAQLKQAIQQFDAAQGRYPKDLQELVPNYLAKIPQVPAGYQISYDAASGKIKVVQQP